MVLNIRKERDYSKKVNVQGFMDAGTISTIKKDLY